MSWIKFETATSEKPEVWAMALSLGIDADAVVGKLLRVWSWFDTQTVEGNAPSVTKALLDAKLGVSGFCDAMIAVDWMHEDAGQISLPNFDRHNGRTAKNRALTSKRVAEHKANNAKVTQPLTQNFDDGNAPSVSSALPREEKIREDKNTNTIPPKSPKGERASFNASEAFFPEALDTNDFRDAWRAWCKHRKEIRKPLTPTQCESQLAQLAGWGIERATAAIHHTITMGWQGLREPDGLKKSTANDDVPF